MEFSLFGITFAIGKSFKIPTVGISLFQITYGSGVTGLFIFEIMFPAFSNKKPVILFDLCFLRPLIKWFAGKVADVQEGR